MVKQIRPAAVAGSFYPDQPTALAKTIAEMLAKTQRPEINGRVMGLICPHAGYIYSGPVASYAYKIIQGLEFRSVIVIAPCHVEAFPGSAVYPGDAYSTPLGDIDIDRELSEKIAAADKRGSVRLSDMGHRLVRRGGEHSLEVQLPFLKTMLGEFKLVAIVMGTQDKASCEALAEAIFSAARNRSDILIVASSDLSHFHPAGEALRLDSRIVNLIDNYDYRNLLEELEAEKVEACGGGPIITAMLACRKLGADSAKVVKYAHSGEITGDNSGVVGYLAAVLFKKSGGKTYEIEDVDERAANETALGSTQSHPAAAVDFGLTAGDKKALLNLARESIRYALQGEKFVPNSADFAGVLSEKRGAFVTLKIDGHLRGCIGNIIGYRPLYETIADMAVQAAFHDPRFKPLSEQEFAKIKLEISVLTPMINVTDPAEIMVGRDGLFITKGYSSGLLLPQVAVEYGWDRETFLNQTCIKAGLPPGTWKQPGTIIQRFQADIFAED